MFGCIELPRETKMLNRLLIAAIVLLTANPVGGNVP